MFEVMEARDVRCAGGQHTRGEYMRRSQRQPMGGESFLSLWELDQT